MTRTGLAPDVLTRLAQLHASWQQAPEAQRATLRDAWFAACHGAWTTLREAPLHSKMTGRENRRRRIRQIQAADAEFGLRNLNDAWLSYVWEDLPAFLAEPLTPGDQTSAAASQLYLGRLVRFLGRTHDRAAYNLLTHDYGHPAGRQQRVSLDEPLDDDENGATLADYLADRSPFRHDSGVFATIHGAVRGWVRDRAARRPRRRAVYEAIGFAWWRHRVLGESVPALLTNYGPRLCRQDYLRECFEQLSEKVRRTLRRGGYTHTPEGACLPDDWSGQRLPGDDLDEAA